MSPTMEPDFDWGGVQASTPVHEKGDYELTIKRLRGRAWPKTDKNGNVTGEVTQVIALTPKIVGEYDSEDNLDTEKEGQDCEEINLWLHSDGGRKMAKGYMMAIAGYNQNDPNDEREFNEFISDLDLTFAAVENETGDGYVLDIGDGWETLLVGKNVRVHMEPETREVEGRDPILQQNYKRLSPVNG